MWQSSCIRGILARYGAILLFVGDNVIIHVRYWSLVRSPRPAAIRESSYCLSQLLHLWLSWEFNFTYSSPIFLRWSLCRLLMSPASGTLVHSLGHNTLGKADIAVQTILLNICLIAVALRLWSRRLQWLSLQVNDCLILGATVSLARNQYNRTHLESPQPI